MAELPKHTVLQFSITSDNKYTACASDLSWGVGEWPEAFRLQVALETEVLMVKTKTKRDPDGELIGCEYTAYTSAPNVHATVFND